MLLGTDLAMDMNGVFNLKNLKMIVEKKPLHVIILLDLAEGACHTEPVHDKEMDEDLDHIYKITGEIRIG